MPIAGIYSQQSEAAAGGGTAAVIESIGRTSFLSDATAHNATMPAGCLTGELILALLTNDGAATISATGFTSVYSVAYGTNVRLSVFAKISVGTEGGTTVNFATSASEQGGAMVYRISNWGGTIATDIVVGTAVQASTANPDPPSLTSGFGVVPTLWFAAAAVSGAATRSSNPTGYSILPGTYSSGGGTGGTTTGMMCSCWKETTAASEDPPSWTFSAATSSSANTIAVRGA